MKKVCVPRGIQTFLFPVYNSHGLKNPPIPLDWFYLFLTCNSLLQVFFILMLKKRQKNEKDTSK